MSASQPGHAQAGPADAWFDAIARLCDAAPGGWRQTRGDALALVSGAAVPTLNVAASTASVAGTASLPALNDAAAAVSATGLPWSVVVRGPAGWGLTEMAARYGLTAQARPSLMACAADGARLLADPGQTALVDRVAGPGPGTFAAALAAGFGVPESAFGGSMSGDVLDSPGFAAYLAGSPDNPLGTGFGVLTGGFIGVFNISVVPAARGRGLGRALTARVMADGFAAGASTAYLHPSADGRALYDSMGFEVAERWTAFTAP